MMYKLSMVDPPCDKVPEKASRWDCGRTEACVDEKSVSGGSLVYWEYLEIYRGGIRSRGATRGPQAHGAPYELVAPSWLFWSSPEPSWGFSGLQKTTVKFHRVWTLFDIDFLKSQKQAKNRNWH